MTMLYSRASSRQAQLRGSYIAISNYVRGRTSPPPQGLMRHFSCQRAERYIQTQQTNAVSQKDIPILKPNQEHSTKPGKPLAEQISQYKDIFHLPAATAQWEIWDLRPNTKSTIHGYITSVRRAGPTLLFVDLVDPQLRKTLQLVVDGAIIGSEMREVVLRTRPHTPVAVTGQFSAKAAPKRGGDGATEQHQVQSSPGTGRLKITYHAQKIHLDPGTEGGTKGGDSAPFEEYFSEFKRDPYVGQVSTTRQIEMSVESITHLNHFPEDIIAQADTNFSADKRHLQLRTSHWLRRSLQARSKAQTECRKYLFKKGFDEIETPILFKSSPEGAREFLVPTRQKGLAYALPQSPQQFKQILMASGISKYFQFARCFRDEDSRADRQPEFTQLDIEMSFASADDVQKITERLIQVLWQTFFLEDPFKEKVRVANEWKKRDLPLHAPFYINHLTYQMAMKFWGSDKPDTRLRGGMYQVQDVLDPILKSKISPLKDPIVDLMRFRLTSDPDETGHFITSFLSDPSAAAYMDNPHGAPGVFIYDPSKPMNGLSAFEHEAGEKIQKHVCPQRGDLLILQARPDKPFLGESSTMAGNLRRDLHATLISQGICREPRAHEFLWIDDFPLFSPITDPDTDPGHGGQAGIKSTHHPFTAPKTWADVEKMTTDPLSCTAAHFDLVINGVEVGGGSRRIHDSKVQEMVLRDILKVPEKGIEDFRPLLEALRAGCPPHAGIALGFDRLMAILRNASSVRDVIAFPKAANGEDRLVGAPAPVDRQRWAEYHMVPE